MHQEASSTFQLVIIMKKANKRLISKIILKLFNHHLKFLLNFNSIIFFLVKVVTI